MQFLAVLLLLIGARGARADFANPNLIPFGEEEAFLGNAGIALDESTGATYYNPGALGFMRNKKISVYGNAYMADHTFVQTAAEVNGLGIPLNSHTFSTVPLSSVTIFGNERNTYAFSIHVPYTASFDFQMPLQSDSTNVTLIGNSASSSLWIGPSMGRQVSSSFGWGLSWFVVRYSQSSLSITNLDAVVSGTSIQATAGFSARQTAWNTLLVAGAQWQLSPLWRLGARLETASLDIRGRSNYYSVGTNAAVSQRFNKLVNENDFYSRYRLPFQIGVGAKYAAAARLDLLLDVSSQFPLDYQTAPSRPLYSDRVITHFVTRGNFGAKLRLNPNHCLLAGFMVNPSSIPAGSAPLNTISNENFKGATLGTQYDTGILVTSVGGFFLWSNGSYQLPVNTGPITSPIHHQIFGLLLSASYKL